MAWGSRVYGLVDFASPHVPEWAEVERREEIARVRDWQRRRLGDFSRSVRSMLGKVDRPASIAEARSLILEWQASGMVPRYPLNGDLWLARRLAALGIVFDARRTNGTATLPHEQERLLDGWAKDCLRLEPEACIQLEALAENLHRWAKWRGLTDEMVSYKRLAAYLRSAGYKSVRRNSGVGFLGIWAGKPRSLPSPADASADDRHLARPL